MYAHVFCGWQPDAKVVAEGEQERYELVEEDKTRLKNEQRETARLRHKAALRKELIKRVSTKPL